MKLKRHLLAGMAAVPAALGVLVALTTSTAAAEPPAEAGAPEAITIAIRGQGMKMRFVVPEGGVASGGTVTIANETGEPHTFTLVRPQLLPHTRKQAEHCFEAGHICLAVAHWHHTDAEHPPAKAYWVVDPGLPGLDTEGSLTRTGDSIFIPPHATTSETVSAPAGTTLHFFCVIHQWMQGALKVR